MNWMAFALISVGSISVANLFQKLAMKKDDSDPLLSSIVFMILNTIFTGVYAALNPFKWPSLELFFPYIILSALCYAFGTLCFFKAIKLIEASLMTILTGFGVVTTIIVSFIFLGERLNPIQFLGIFLILISIVIINFHNKSFTLNKGVFLSILGTSLYGLAVTFDAHILKSIDAISYTPVISFLPAVILLLVNFKKLNHFIKNISQKINKNHFIYSFLYSIQAITYYLALEHGALASQMNSVFKSEIVLTVILASIFLNERSHIGLKFLSAVTTTIGILLIK